MISPGLTDLRCRLRPWPPERPPPLRLVLYLSLLSSFLASALEPKSHRGGWSLAMARLLYLGRFLQQELHPSFPSLLDFGIGTLLLSDHHRHQLPIPSSLIHAAQEWASSPCPQSLSFFPSSPPKSHWILVAIVTVFERVGDILISWLPMYSEAKLSFFVYLWHPKTRGTTYVYDAFFRPYISKHETEIDRRLLELKTRRQEHELFSLSSCGTYKLQDLDGRSIPRTWSSDNLRVYHQ